LNGTIKKAQANIANHRIRFEDVATVFDDPLQRSYPTIENGEERWLTVGRSRFHKILLVVHTMKELPDDTEIIRIIGARELEPTERREYELG